MGSFLVPPQFQPTEPPLFNGADDDVLTIVGGVRTWAPGGGGGGTTGYLGTYIHDAPAAGSHTAYAPAGFGPGVGRYDVDTSAGDVEFVSLTPGTDGQLLNITNIGANNLILDTPGFRLPAQMFIVENDAQLLCFYGGTINKWCMA